MNKMRCLLLALLVMLSLTACGKETNSTDAEFVPFVRFFSESEQPTDIPLTAPDVATMQTVLQKAEWTALAPEASDARDGELHLTGDAPILFRFSDNVLMREGQVTDLPPELYDLLHAIAGTDTSGTQPLNAVCETAIGMLPEQIALLPATEEEVLSVIPAWSNVACRQLVAYFPPVYGTACEIIMAEVEPTDVERAAQILQDYIDRLAGDIAYPENAQGWKNNATVTVRDNVVTLCVLPEDITVPDAFLGGF